MSQASDSLVLILGVTNRTGTNYLADLLRKHPRLGKPKELAEDYLLVRAELLREYVDETIVHWGDDARERSEHYRRLLLRRFGEALLSVVDDNTEEGLRPVLKTPRALNLEFLPELFPQAQVLFIVRDGRDVVESARRTFTHLSAEIWMERWAEGTRSMLDFMDAGNEAGRRVSWKLVHYEELFANPQEVTADVLEFLGEDVSAYPWDNVDSLPLRGSSTARGGREDVHWDPVPRPRNFNPIGRWHSWGWLRKRQFKKIAGAELIRAGYVEDDSW